MDKYSIIRISDRPDLEDEAVKWFHSKWGIPESAYKESMDECIKRLSAFPEWYLCMDKNVITGGMGVIANDFHERKDLCPNVCAVYTEKDYRCRGIAGKILNFVCEDMKKRGVSTLYLVTDHTSFYERYGWKFYCMVKCDGEQDESRIYIHR